MGCCRRDERIMGFEWRKKLGFFPKVILGLLVGFVLFEPARSLRPLRERARSWGDEDLSPESTIMDVDDHVTKDNFALKAYLWAGVLWLFVKKEDSNMASFSSWNISGTYRGTWKFLDSANISSRFPDFQRSDGNSVIELMSTPTKITGVHYVQVKHLTDGLP
ncbi:Transmembrane E3 ubiquitin-protein ligase FLY2 [Bienertia sinuspersici]